MTQVTNYAVPNGPRAEVRTGINAVLAALRDGNAGNTAPLNPVPGMIWRDTSGAAPILRLRNAANDGWLALHQEIGMSATGLALAAATDPLAAQVALGLAGAPTVITTTTFTVGAGQNYILNAASGTVTITLPTPSENLGRVIFVANAAARILSSASANVVSLTGGGAGTAILTAGVGHWATLVSDGTNWRIVSSFGFATQAQAEAGTESTLALSAVRTKNAIAAQARLKSGILGPLTATGASGVLEFTGLNPLCKKLTLILDGLSGSTSDYKDIDLGTAAGYPAVTYDMVTTWFSGGSTNSGRYSTTAELPIVTYTSADANTGFVEFVNVAGNDWFFKGQITLNSSESNFFTGRVTMPAVVDRLRVVAKAGTLDAGKVYLVQEFL